MRLKQELVTTAELVNVVLKREQLKREAAQQAKAVWEKREDFANLKRKFPSLLNAKEDEELFYDKERVVKKAKPAEQSYAFCLSPWVCELMLMCLQSHWGQTQVARQWRPCISWIAPRHGRTSKGTYCSNPGTGRSGDGSDQRARSPLGRRN